MAELLKIDGFATKEIALSQKPINEVLKESEGVLISFTKANVKKNLTALVKKHSKEIDELIAKDQLTTKEENRLIELRKIHKEPRIALDKITKHNSSVLAQASKSSKVVKDELTLIVEPTETKITNRLENEEKRRENARIEKENQETERKNKLQNIVNIVASDLQSIIDSTKEYSQIEENEKQFGSILSIFDNKVVDKLIDLEDYDLVYSSMVDEKSEQFDSLIKQLTTQYDLDQSNKALEVAKLTNERMSELFDYEYKYKGEKPLGELSIDEYTTLKINARADFRIDILEDKIGLLGNEKLQSWIYATDTDIILVEIKLNEIRELSDLDFNKKVEHFKSEIFDWNNPKEVEVNEIAVDLSTENSKDASATIELKNQEIISIVVNETHNEFEKEAKENLENSISFEPKLISTQDADRYQELFNYLHDLGVIALIEEMQHIERIVLKMQ